MARTGCYKVGIGLDNSRAARFLAARLIRIWKQTDRATSIQWKGFMRIILAQLIHLTNYPCRFIWSSDARGSYCPHASRLWVGFDIYMRTSLCVCFKCELYNCTYMHIYSYIHLTSIIIAIHTISSYTFMLLFFFHNIPAAKFHSLYTLSLEWCGKGQCMIWLFDWLQCRLRYLNEASLTGIV